MHAWGYGHTLALTSTMTVDTVPKANRRLESEMTSGSL